MDSIPLNLMSCPRLICQQDSNGNENCPFLEQRDICDFVNPEKTAGKKQHNFWQKWFVVLSVWINLVHWKWILNWSDGLVLKQSSELYLIRTTGAWFIEIYCLTFIEFTHTAICFGLVSWFTSSASMVCLNLQDCWWMFGDCWRFSP